MIFKNSLLKSIVIYFFTDGLTRALPFIVFPIVAFYLTTEEFGLISNFQVLLSIILPLINLSSSSYFSVDFYKESFEIDKDYTNISVFNLIALIFVSLFIIFSRKWITSLTGLTNLWICIALLCAFFQNISDLYLTRLRLEEKSNIFGLFNIFISFIGASFTVLFLIYFNLGLEGRLYSLVLQIISGGVIAIHLSKKYFRSMNYINFYKMKEYLIFGLPLLPHTMSLWLRSGFEKLFITSSISLSSNGVYSFALTISSVFTIFSQAFFAAFSPFVFKNLGNLSNDSNTDNNLNVVKQSIVKKAQIFLFAYLIFLVLGYFVGYFLISIFFREKYMDAIVYLPYLLIFNFFNACYVLVSIVVYYSKATKFLGIISISASFFQILLMIFLVNQIGPKGAAISNMLISILTLILVLKYSNKVYPMPWLKLKLSFK
jgi:O-antigen/teichoic acid export membrane protein